MNERPNASEFTLKSFGAPPPSPSGMGRITPWMKMAATGGLAAAALMYGLQKLPDNWRPGSVAGDAAGDAVRHEIEAMKEAKIDMERRIADATAQANAKAQADLLVQTKILEERTASLGPISILAGLADAGCIGARIVSKMTQPQGLGRQSSDDLYYASQQVGAATCGMGNPLRQGVTASQIESVSTAATARGAPMTNGAVQTVTASAPAASPPSLPTTVVMAEKISTTITTASRHYSPDEIEVSERYLTTLPDKVRWFLWGTLPKADRLDVFVDRQRAYEAAIKYL